MMTGPELRAWRVQRQLSQAQLGHLFGGLSAQRISRLERGVVRVQPEHALLCILLAQPAILRAVAARQGVGLREA